MRTKSTIFSLLMGLAVIGVSMDAGAQGRGRDRDHERHGNNGHDNRDRHDSYSNNRRDHDHDRDRHHHHDYRRRDVHIHYHDRYCGHTPVVVHHHHNRPRYIYYRDYDVYYDFERSVYISYSGSNWTVTTALPIAMRHVNVRTTRSYEVDYYNDDMPAYLVRSRPSCGREFNGW